MLRRRPKWAAASLCALLLTSLLAAQTQKPAATTTPSATRADSEHDISGMYTFLREGEFVQVNVEDGVKADDRGATAADKGTLAKVNRVTGFVSRFGDLESDKGAFLDHFFSKGALNANELSFTTKTIHGVWFEFKGKVERGAAKSRAEEGYYVIRGTLKRISVDANNKKTSAQSREVVFKSFPDLDTNADPS